MEENIIIQNIRSGDKKELEKLYINYREEFMIWSISRYKITTDDAKEIYQQGILVLYENIINGKLINLRSSIKTYLYAICKNKLYEYKRDINKKTTIDNGKTQEENTSDETEQKEYLISMSEKSLDKMGNPCKTLLENYYYHKKSMKQISIEMGYKNENTAKNQKYKCLSRLREIFNLEINNNKSLSYA